MKSDQFMLEHWAEVLAAIVLLLGFLIALVLRSTLIHYLVILVAGLLAGRIIYAKYKKQPIFPFILIIIGFLLGFMLGAITANKIAIIIVFAVGASISYWIHKEGYVGFFKEEGFVR
jgi:hypothetical protein